MRCIKMIKIFSKIFDEDIEIGELANFIYRVRKDNNFLGDQTIELIKKELVETRDAYKFLLYYAYINERLVGLLLLSINIPKFGFIWDWYPYVEPGPKEDLVAIELLKNCIENTGRDIDRFEVAFTIETEQDKAQYIRYSKWFESLNFHRIAEEAVMELTLENKEFEPHAFPKNIDLNTSDLDKKKHTFKHGVALNVTRTRVTVLVFNLSIISFMLSMLKTSTGLEHLSTSVALFLGFCLTLLGLWLLLYSQSWDKLGLSRPWPFVLGSMTTYLALSQTVTAFMHEYLLGLKAVFKTVPSDHADYNNLLMLNETVIFLLFLMALPSCFTNIIV